MRQDGVYCHFQFATVALIVMAASSLRVDSPNMKHWNYSNNFNA